jgi:hypothetical protein
LEIPGILGDRFSFFDEMAALRTQVAGLSDFFICLIRVQVVCLDSPGRFLGHGILNSASRGAAITRRRQEAGGRRRGTKGIRHFME